MRAILLVILFSTILFSAQKQIILGSFLKEQSALTAIKQLNDYISKDNRIKEFIKNTQLNIKFKKIERYYVISLLPLKNYTQLLRALELLKKYYKNAYVLDYLTLKAETKQTDEAEKILEIIKLIETYEKKAKN